MLGWVAQTLTGRCDRTHQLRRLIGDDQDYGQELERAFDLSLVAGMSPVEATATLLGLRQHFSSLGYSSNIRAAIEDFHELVAGAPHSVVSLYLELLPDFRASKTRELLEPVLEPCASLPAVERVETLRRLRQFENLGSHGLLASSYQAFQAEVTAGSTPREAFQRLEWLDNQLSPQAYSSSSRSAIEAYSRWASGPNRETNRQRLAVLFESGLSGSELALALKQVSDIQPEDWEFYQSFILTKPHYNRPSVREQVFGAYLAERGQGTQKEETAARLERLGEAVVATRPYNSALAETFRGYATYLAGGPDKEPARLYLQELIEEGIEASERTRLLNLVLRPVDGLTLGEKLQTARRFASHADRNFLNSASRQLLLECCWAEVEAGTPLEKAVRRLESLEDPVLSSRSQLLNTLVAYRDHLCGGEELQPLREFLLELAAKGVAGSELQQAVECLTPDRIRAYRRVVLDQKDINRDGIRGPAFEVYLKEVERGCSEEQAEAIVKNLLQAHQKVKSTYRAVQ